MPTKIIIKNINNTKKKTVNPSKLLPKLKISDNSDKNSLNPVVSEKIKNNNNKKTKITNKKNSNTNKKETVKNDSHKSQAHKKRKESKPEEKNATVRKKKIHNGSKAEPLDKIDGIILLKHKMHREIFQRCLERKLTSGSEAWEETEPETQLEIE